jgi:hypothetical protein
MLPKAQKKKKKKKVDILSSVLGAEFTIDFSYIAFFFLKKKKKHFKNVSNELKHKFEYIKNLCEHRCSLN